MAYAGNYICTSFVHLRWTVYMNSDSLLLSVVSIVHHHQCLTQGPGATIPAELTRYVTLV